MQPEQLMLYMYMLGYILLDTKLLDYEVIMTRQVTSGPT